jgi:hypothetical protein
MNEILSKLAQCIEVGKIDKTSPYPPAMSDQDGASELTKKALENGIIHNEILGNALIPAMANADFYSPDPEGAVNYLKNCMA